MGSFTFNLDHGEKAVNVVVEGMFNQQNAVDFMSEYQRNVAGIKTAEYALLFDAKNLKVSSQEMLPMLEECMKLYDRTGFQKIVINMGSSVIAKTQMKKVVAKTGLRNCEVL
ncbi:MAG TPA: hypothetical protein VHP38_09680 [Ruminiclostridium sp.]|nr:hypothetical protein [Ruminiclostridium sp.]